jgi:spermidine synthase
VLIAACFFLSGAAALVLQVLWTRMLGHVFGATALAVSTTLTAFMGGLALGAHLGGRWAGGKWGQRLNVHPVRLFAALEIVVGAYGLLVPSLLDLVVPVQQAMGAVLGESYLAYSLVRFVLVAGILLLPTTAMGATLPILAEAVVKLGRDVASKVGRLYAANTFGAVFGAVLAGFWLIPELGVSTTVRIAAAMDLVVALTVLALFALARGDRLLVGVDRATTPQAILDALEPIVVEDVTPSRQRLALLTFAISGGAAMILEVLWTRAVGVVIGASTHAFTLILATFLVGLSVGAAVITRFIDRIARPVRALAWAQAAVGVFALAGTLLVDRLPFILHEAARARDVTMGNIYSTHLLISGLVMLPATLALGTVMPLVVRILAPDGAEHAGPIVGRAYTLNTLGCIVGSFAGGFVVLPLAGVEGGLMLAVGLNLALAAALALALGPPRRGLMLAVAAGAAGIALRPAWDVPRWTAGLFRFSLTRNVFQDAWSWDGKLLFHEDGIASTVTVEGGRDGVGVSLKVNGKVDASDIGDMPTQVLSGLLPVLTHRAPKDVLVIGYGSGVTPGAILQAPVERVDLVELESAVLEASNRFFSHVNHNPPSDPRFRAIVDDGRNFLLGHPRPYDVIVSEPSNPWMSGASSLFTRDFFHIASSRLADDGVFLQWLQLYELSDENVRTLFATFASVFPEVVVFSPSARSNDTLVLGARRPFKIDRARWAAAFADPRLGPELRRAELDAPEDLVGLFLQGRAEVARFAEGGRINTDDDPVIEFEAPKDLLEYAIRDAKLTFLRDVDGRRIAAAEPHLAGFGLDRPAVLADVARRMVRQGRFDDAEDAVRRARASTSTTSDATERSLDHTLELMGRFLEAETEPVVVATPETKRDETYAEAVRYLLHQRERDAVRVVDRVDGFERRGTPQRFLYAYLCYRNDRTLDAEYLIDGVLEDAAFVREQAAALYYGARIQLERGRYPRAVELMEQFMAADGE